jgi:hypothetical protein
VTSGAGGSWTADAGHCIREIVQLDYVRSGIRFDPAQCVSSGCANRSRC